MLTLGLFQPTGRIPVFSVLQNPKFRVLWYVGGLTAVLQIVEANRTANRSILLD